MTKDKFRELCEQVLIPMLGNLMFQQRASHHEALDTIAQELLQIRLVLSRLARGESHSDDATNG
jgi:hypothetical protein